jgi:ATP-binding cassette, subfamily B, multidrug efflux pump
MSDTDERPTADTGDTGEGSPDDAPQLSTTAAAEMRGGRFSTVGVPTEKSKDFQGSLRRLLRLMDRDRPKVALILVMAVASVVLVVIGPRILGRATDIIFDGVITGAGIDFGNLHRTLGFAIAVYVVSYLLGYAQAYMLAGVVQRTMFRLRSDVEGKLHRLPLSYIDTHARGDLLSRVTNDIDNVSQSIQQSLSQLLTGVLTIVGTLAMMLWISWELAIVAIVTIPVALLMMKQVAGQSKSRFISQWMHTGSLNAQVEEAFTGHAIVKAFGQQSEVEARFRETNDDLFRSSFMAQFISGCIQPLMFFISNLNYVAIAVLGAVKVANGSISLGDVQAFIQYSRQFTMPMTQTASMVNVLQSGIASAERVFELLDADEEPAPVAVDRHVGERADSADAAGDASDAPVGRVEFRDVSFSYERDRPLIQELSLTAEPGHTVAIVGPTGAGKTTLVNLIMRYYELDGGAILIDGRDITDMSRQDLRSRIGMVLQDTWLFSGTILDNLRYGNLDATDDEIRAAAKACYVDRFVHSLPEGYLTVIDDEGSSVSAGEKQLITIARAFLGDPAILILDEATSSVDTRTEVLIQRAMGALRANRTSFVIAHRLSTIRDAHTILVMDGGRIVEQGNHDELLHHGGAYHALFMSQFAGAATDIA